ncbi:Mitochondrial carrier domain superfamily [Arabidopsis thaliana x Arabidopsis arenosa]|uniref:Mitochondrial carrier domain superfamily n=1 Tax=Arabidopsis thaliana x Arabidopsis arenosa TaxID=1240361 RepID=A0A8T2A7F9_9BRAS|nr:Mitochondrial carrier domain superfamily [Arabidopsis thaliana x Arabidopsis arenosa]
MGEKKTTTTGEGLGFYKEYVAGMMAGLATVAVGHPFDTVKVKLQKHNTDVQGLRYKNGLHCASRILQTEGVKGLYRGATSSFLGMAFESSLMFGIYSQAKLFLRGTMPDDGPRPEIIVPSAMFGGAIISFVLCPTELVKCRMQIQGTDSLVPNFRRYKSPLDCAVQTVKNEGVTGIFRGGSATLLRECAGNAVFFTVYEYLRYHIHSRLEDSKLKDGYLVDMGIGVFTGGLGGIACWSAVLPFDVAKTIIQTSSDKATERNPFKVLSSIHKRAGIKGCYAGLGPTIVRAFPANAAAIVAWEFSMKMLGIKRD